MTSIPVRHHSEAPPQAAATSSQRARRELQRRWPTVLGACAAAVSAGATAHVSQALHLAVSAWAVLLAGVVYLSWGSARGELQRPRMLGVQTAGVLAFGGLAVLALSVDPDLGRYVLAGGWLGHAAWDVFHHRADCVVPRWYAEMCLTADLLLAGALIFAPWNGA